MLGSLPGEASLAAGRYYAHPRNAFWRLMGEVLGEDLQARDYEDRLATLIRHRVGLWDVVGEATRPGSLDTA
ncbi:MAG: DNA-deoxyinosine glycosylase, partial [Brevundimonas sp.]